MVEESPKEDLSGREELERQRLALEVEEIQRRRTGWGMVVHLVPIIAPSAAFLGAIVGAVWTILKELARRRLEVVTNLKKEIASENQAVRIAAVRALADYPREVTHLLIACLGATREVQQGERLIKEEDRAFTSAVKDALRQIGEKMRGLKGQWCTKRALVKPHLRIPLRSLLKDPG